MRVDAALPPPLSEKFSVRWFLKIGVAMLATLCAEFRSLTDTDGINAHRYSSAAVAESSISAKPRRRSGFALRSGEL